MATTVLDRLVTILGFEVDDRSLTDAEKRVDKFKKKMDEVGNKLALGGAALTAGLALVGNSVLNFEKEMNALGAATNASAEEMVLLREQAKLLGRQTVFSASQAAAAQTELGKAGLSTTEILETMNGVLALAAAGQLGMSEAAGITTSIMAAFKLETKDSAVVADVLAAAAASAKTTVSEMGFALSKAAPTAQALGLSLQETSAALAVMQNNGLRAEVAGTGLRTILLKLSKPSKEATTALTKLGLSSKFVADAMEDGRLNEVMAKLGEANIGAADAAAIFGLEATSQGLILAGSTEQLKELQAAYENAGGAAQRMADRQMAGLPGAVARLMSKFEGLLLLLGEAGVTGFLNRLAEGLGAVIDLFVSAPPFVQHLVASLLTFGPALLGLALAFKTVAFAVGIFNAAILANPFGLIVAGVLAVIFVLNTLATFWDDIVEGFTKGFQFIGGIFGKIGDFLGIGETEIIANRTAPAASTITAGGGVSNTTQTSSIEVGKIEINAQGADSREIAQNVSGELRNQLQNTAQDFNSSIAR